jgi:hypothetical protein
VGGGQQSQAGGSSQQGGRSSQGSDRNLGDDSLGSDSDRDVQQGSSNTNRGSGEQSR